MTQQFHTSILVPQKLCGNIQRDLQDCSLSIVCNSKNWNTKCSSIWKWVNTLIIFPYNEKIALFEPLQGRKPNKLKRSMYICFIYAMPTNYHSSYPERMGLGVESGTFIFLLYIFPLFAAGFFFTRRMYIIYKSSHNRKDVALFNLKAYNSLIIQHPANVTIPIISSFSQALESLSTLFFIIYPFSPNLNLHCATHAHHPHSPPKLPAVHCGWPRWH